MSCKKVVAHRGRVASFRGLRAGAESSTVCVSAVGRTFRAKFL